MQINPQSYLQPKEIDWHNLPCKQQPPSNSGAQQKWFSLLQQPYQPQTKLDYQLHHKQWPLMVIQVLSLILQRQGYAKLQCYECCSKQTRQLAKPNPCFVTMKRRQDSAGLAPHFAMEPFCLAIHLRMVCGGSIMLHTKCPKQCLPKSRQKAWIMVTN